VKAHDGNYGNELADHLAREAACSSDDDIACIKIPKPAVTSALRETCVQVWRSEWDDSKKGELTKTFFPFVKDKISKKTANVHKIITR